MCERRQDRGSSMRTSNFSRVFAPALRDLRTWHVRTAAAPFFVLSKEGTRWQRGSAPADGNAGSSTEDERRSGGGFRRWVIRVPAGRRARLGT